MAEEIDVHSMLLRAEAKSKKQLEEMQAAYGPKHSVCFELEEKYARAIAVRKTWEAFERGASKENQSGSSFDIDPKCAQCGTRRSICKHPNAPASHCCHRCSHAD